MGSVAAARHSRDGRGRACGVVAITLMLVTAMVALALPAAAAAGGFDTPGNLLVADQYNNRVIELNGVGRIVWHFGTGAAAAGAHNVVAPQALERTSSGRTLLVGGTVEAGTPGYPAEGLVDGRVLIVNRFGRIVWHYGQAGVSGAGPGQLDHPVDATRLSSGHVLIVDQGNERVIEIGAKKQIVWQYGTTGGAGSGPGQLDHPAAVELMPTGRILIVDQGNDRLIEVTRKKRITWQYGAPGDAATLDDPLSACLLPSGRLLVTDAGNSRVVRVTRDKVVDWTYPVSAPPGVAAQPLPCDAVARKGHYLISATADHQVFEIARDGTMVWSYGTLGVSGIHWGQLNAPRRIAIVPSEYAISEGLRVHGGG